MLTRAEQDELIVSHLPQAYAIAVSIYNRIGHRMPLEDLKQYGALGLCLAAAKFDPSLGWKFDTYAQHKIRGSIMDGIRRETRSRNQTERDLLPTQMVSLDALIYPPADERADHDYAAITARLDVATLIKRLTVKQLAAIDLVFLHEKTQADVASEMGHHQTSVSYWIRDARNRMSAAA